MRTVWFAMIAATVTIATCRTGDWKLNFLLLSISHLTVPLAIYGTVLNYKTSFGQILDSRPIRYVGRVSYSLYLWQQLFLVRDDVLANSGISLFQTFPVNVVAAFICAISSYYCIEMPLIHLGRKLTLTFRSRSLAAN